VDFQVAGQIMLPFYPLKNREVFAGKVGKNARWGGLVQAAKYP